MADGTAGGVADNLIALMLNGTAFSGYTATYAQLHVGAPGAAGTANIASNNTRQAAGTFARASAGNWQNSAAINWTSVPTTETYNNVTLWSAATAGTFIQSGTISGGAVTAGQNFQIPANSLTVSTPVAS